MLIISLTIGVALPGVAFCVTPGPAAPRVPAHVPTWAYDDGCSGGKGASADLVRHWVSFAESNCGPRARKALRDCSSRGVTYCRAVEYLDANWIFRDGGVPIGHVAGNSWWLHRPGYRDAAHRIYSAAYGGGEIVDQRNRAVDAWFQRFVRRRYSRYRILMMDHSSASVRDELYYTGLRTSEEIRSDRVLQASHEKMAAALTRADGSPFLQFDNALNVNPWLPAPFAMVAHPASVVGVVTEGAPIEDGVMTPWYSTLLDDMAYVDAHPREWLVLLSYDPTGGRRARRVQAATEWLGYSANHIVSWSDLETDRNRLAVWPEEGIVPTHAVQSLAAPAGRGCLAGTGIVCARGGHNALRAAPGVFRREFRVCFYRRQRFGRCAAIVNANSYPVVIRRQWLSLRYRHQIGFVGGDVQQGGRVAIRGVRFRAGQVLPAHDAILLTG